MKSRTVAVVLALLLAAAGRADAACEAPESALGVARVVELDASNGPIYGAFTRFTREPSFLGPKEVVLTFDDGPAVGLTRSILATLDRFCTKATFFEVGRMAVANPDTVRLVLAHGHTVGSHTWSHPMHLVRMKPEAAKDEIERGFAAVALAAGRPIAPFFRFPGLSDSQTLLTHLQQRHIAAMSVDVISNDSFIPSVDKLVKNTLERVEQRNGGIILFHDIKPQTAKALPVILTELKARGFRIVHMRSKYGFEPDPVATAALRPMFARGNSARQDVSMLGVPSADETVDGNVPVTRLAPALRPVALAMHNHGTVAGSAADAGGTPGRSEQQGRSYRPADEPLSNVNGWSISIQRMRPSHHDAD